MTFHQYGYEIVRSAIPPEVIKYIVISAKIEETANLFFRPSTSHQPFPFNDPTSYQSYSSYSAIYVESLLIYLKPIMEKITGKTLEPTYTYYRHYFNKAVLAKHTDRPSCEYSATICLDKDADWPIYYELADKTTVEVNLAPGDMAIYKGCELPHWRNQYEGVSHLQAFIHYVDFNGQYGKDFRYDQRPVLGVQKKR